MERNRVDALEERIRRLRATADRLCEEYAAVRRQVHALEAAIDNSPASDKGVPPSRPKSTRPPAERATQPEERTATERDRGDEATDAEVAAAIRAVETDRDEAAADEHGDDILVA